MLRKYARREEGYSYRLLLGFADLGSALFGPGSGLLLGCLFRRRTFLLHVFLGALFCRLLRLHGLDVFLYHTHGLPPEKRGLYVLSGGGCLHLLRLHTILFGEGLVLVRQFLLADLQLLRFGHSVQSHFRFDLVLSGKYCWKGRP